MRQLISRYFYTIILFLITILFFCGGLGVKLYWVEIAGLLLSSLSILLLYNLKEDITFPKGIFLYVLFILVLIVSLVWSKNFYYSLEQFLLFTSAGFFWILFYNLKDKISESFSITIFILGILFFILFLLKKLFNFDLVNSQWNIYGKYTEIHNHIGDYWAIVTLVLINWMQKKFKWWHLVAITFGLLLVGFSLSRSAFLALFVGIAYFFSRKGEFQKYRRFFWLGVLAISAMFIVSGFTKTTFFSRPYFYQAVVAVTKNPLGFGLGNFGDASRIGGNFLGVQNSSVRAHNIFLEVISGIGVFGIIFIFWFIKILKSVLNNKQNDSLLFQTIFLLITTNFFFDSTYYLPVMLWLWFAVLGLAQP